MVDAKTILECGGWVTLIFYCLYKWFDNKGFHNGRHWSIIVYLFILIIVTILAMLLSV